MTLNDTILDLLSDKIKQDVRTPDGATILARDIEKECNEYGYEEKTPSLNTIKRLVGVFPPTITRPATLNVIAKYLDYEDWPALAQDYNIRLESGFIKRDIFKDMSSIDRGCLVEVAWKPERRLLLRHDGNGQYCVIKSKNCKLIPGDLLSLYSLSLGYPFIADKVFRDEKPLGTYRSADGSALHVLKIIR